MQDAVEQAAVAALAVAWVNPAKVRRRSRWQGAPVPVVHLHLRRRPALRAARFLDLRLRPPAISLEVFPARPAVAAVAAPVAPSFRAPTRRTSSGPTAIYTRSTFKTAGTT